MDVVVVHGSAADIETPFLVLPIFEEQAEPSGATRMVDDLLGGEIARLIADNEISGSLGEVTVLHVAGGSAVRARRVAVVGLGKRDELAPENVRIAAASAARRARDLRLNALATVVHGADDGALDPLEVCRVTVEATLMALYTYEAQRQEPPKTRPPERLVVVEADADRARGFEAVAATARETAEVINRVRDLSVAPGNVVTPAVLAERAREVADRHGIEITVFGKDELAAKGMHAILAVNAGSVLPPVLVSMRYTAPGATRTLAVVGKGITFDSGGISIKPAEHMEFMRHDMTGAATVIGFVDLAARTKLPVNVLGVFAATENLPSGSSYKPGDVYRAYNGKTMEIVNTDAEGRVILSDALAWTAEQKPDAIIDLATLTGACQVALGDHATGLFSNDQRLADLLLQAGEVSGDRCWQMPLWPVYGEQIKTSMADVRNTGGRRAGAITAALFLKEFVDGTPWAHLDIAGTAYADGEQKWVAPYNPRPGATGVGVRLLWHFARAWKDA